MTILFMIEAESEAERAAGVLQAPSWSVNGFYKFQLRLAACFGPRGSRHEDVIDTLIECQVDSFIAPALCETISERLQALVRGWPDADYDRIMALRLVAMLNRCTAIGSNLIIC